MRLAITDNPGLRTMHHVAIIPARAGSKRLPGKNVMSLGGTPLIGWTIAAALESGCFATIMVSTDSPQIRDVAVGCGAEVPFLRSAELATDAASSTDVVLDHLERTGLSRRRDPHQVAVTLLQPTSPFRRALTIRRAIADFEADPLCSLIGVTAPPVPLEWHRHLDARGRLLGASESPPSPGRPCVLSGLIYVTGLVSLLHHRSLYGDEPRGFFVDDRIESLDIDTSADWEVAAALVAAGAVTRAAADARK